MFQWAMLWAWWFTWRLAVSLVCLFTIHNVVHHEGYFIEYKTLLVAGVCAVVGIRVWMPSTKETKDHSDLNQD